MSSSPVFDRLSTSFKASNSERNKAWPWPILQEGAQFKVKEHFLKRWTQHPNFWKAELTRLRSITPVNGAPCPLDLCCFLFLFSARHPRLELTRPNKKTSGPKFGIFVVEPLNSYVSAKILGMWSSLSFGSPTDVSVSV